MPIGWAGACARSRSWGWVCGHVPHLHVDREVGRGGSLLGGERTLDSECPRPLRRAPALSCPPEVTAALSVLLSFENGTPDGFPHAAVAKNPNAGVCTTRLASSSTHTQ